MRGQLVDDAPEPLALVHVLQVRDLVRGDVVLHELRRHHQSPAERERSIDGTTAPTAARVLHRYPAWRDIDARGFLNHQGGQALQRFSAKEIGDTTRQELRRSAYMQFAALDPCASA